MSVNGDTHLSLTDLSLTTSTPAESPRNLQEDEDQRSSFSMERIPERKWTKIYGRIKLAVSPSGDWNLKDKSATRVRKVVRSTFRVVFHSRLARFFADVTRAFMKKCPPSWTFSTLFLFILGILTALVGVAMDLFGDELDILHKMIVGSGNLPHPSIEYFVWLFYSCICLALAIWLTARIAPAANGSGIPELRSILSGVYLSEYLSFRTLIAKVIGLTLAVGSGLFLGKEGPLVHCAAIIGNQLSRFTIFEKIRKNPNVMQQMLCCSCAAGIGANLGAPIGGVLFSIEVTSTYYPLRNYWYGFLASIAGAITWRGLYNLRWNDPWLSIFIPTDFTKHDFSVEELCAFIILGIISALFAEVFIRLSSRVKKILGKISTDKWYRSPYVYGALIVVTTSTITFPRFIGDFMSIGPAGAMKDLMSQKELTDESLIAKDWSKYDPIVSLTLFFFLRFFLCSLSIALQVPLGILMPSLAAGTALGRLYGEILHRIFTVPHFVVPGGFAVVGSASLFGSMTHSISIAVIIFEITGQIQLLIPVLVSIVVGIGIKRKLSALSIYDKISKEKHLPYLPDIEQDQFETSAADIMDTRLTYLASQFTREQVEEALKNKDYLDFPVVDDDENFRLIGTVPRELLEDMLVKTERQRSGAQLSIGPKYINMIHTPMVQLSETTPLSDIHSIFITMRLFQVFIVRQDRLVGTIHRSVLQDVISKQNERFTLNSRWRDLFVNK